MSTVVFPGLGLELQIDNVAFSIAGFEVYWYGLLIGFSLFLGLIFAMRNARRFGLDTDRMLDVVFVGAIVGVICGRIYYIVCRPEEFPTFLAMLNIRGGGMAIYGVLIGGFLSALVMCKIRKVNAPAMFDIASVCFLLGQGIGRWGNFFNEEAFGSNTTLPWGMTSSKIRSYLFSHAAALAEKGVTVDPSVPVHPTFFYESVWCLVGALILLIYMKRRKFDGEMFLMYGLWYGVGRAIIEGLRTDSLYVGSIRISQLVGIVAAVVCFALIVFVRAKQNKDASYRPVFAGTQECADYFAQLDKERQEKKNSKKADSEKADAESSQSDKTEEKDDKEPKGGR